jgi:hypothetical protein
LIRCANGLDSSGARARALVQQANQHSEQTVQARTDIPSPKVFDAVNNQLRVVAQANAQSGGAYAIPVAQLNAQKTALEKQAAQGYAAYHAATDVTTAGDVNSAQDVTGGAAAGSPGSDPSSGAAGQDSGLPDTHAASGALSPEKAGELAAMIPAVLGAAGGLVGGALSTIGKVPEALMQAGTQAAGAATQSLSGLMTPRLNDRTAVAGGIGPLNDTSNRDGPGGAGSGGGDTTRAAGGPAGTPPPVLPSTGRAPTPPAMPSGALPEPVQPSAAGSGMMPMGMPLGGMPGGAAGAGGGQDRPVPPKKVVVPPTPHTESVTGRVSIDRLAMSVTAPEPRDPQPPSDDQPPQGPRPIIRRITATRPEDEES